MKRIIYMLLMCSILCLITACESKEKIEEQASTDFQEQTAEAITKETTATTTEAAIESTTENITETTIDDIKETETTEIHSPLYNEKYTVEEVIRYFGEVVFDVEYLTGNGNYELVQKWNIPLYYRITGEDILLNFNLSGAFTE